MPDYKEIKRAVKEKEDYIIGCRRWLHIHPEVSGKEFKTIEYIAGELERDGQNYVVVENGGILVFLGSEKQGSGKTVLLRADVDALEVTEDLENLAGPRICVSENNGFFHACGHDGHAAMLLGAAKVLKEHEDDIPGRIVLMFERGEEDTENIRWLFQYMEQNKINVDTVYGSHLYAGLESGKISVNAGPVMSGIVTFHVTIKGKAGHGSRPDLAASPIDCFHAIYSELLSVKQNRIGPFNAFTFSIGSLHAGTAANIIPGELSFSGTVRCFDCADGALFAEEMTKRIKAVCELHECVLDRYSLYGPSTPVINNGELAQLAQDAVKELDPQLLGSVDPWMASEPFGMALLKWPGVYAFVGIRNLAKGVGAEHHNSKFDIDEAALKYGCASYVAYALKYLENADKISARPSDISFRDLYEKFGYSDDTLDLFE